MKLKSISQRTTIHDGGLTFLDNLAGVTSFKVSAPVVAVQSAPSVERAAKISSPAPVLAQSEAFALSALQEAASNQPLFVAEHRLETPLVLPASVFDPDFQATGSTLSLHQWDAPITETARLDTVFLDQFNMVRDLDPTDMGPPLDVRGMIRGLGGPQGSPLGLTQDRWDIDI